MCNLTSQILINTYSNHFRSLRLWDGGGDGKKHQHIMKPRGPQGRRTVPTACTFSPDGVYVAGACQDGSIQMWDTRRMFVNVSLQTKNAHQNGTDTSCIKFSYDGKMLVSRGGKYFHITVFIGKSLANAISCHEVQPSKYIHIIVVNIIFKSNFKNYVP